MAIFHMIRNPSLMGMLLSPMIFISLLAPLACGPSTEPEPKSETPEQNFEIEDILAKKLELDANTVGQAKNLGQNQDAAKEELALWQQYYGQLSSLVEASPAPDSYRYRIAAAVAAKSIRLDTLVELGAFKSEGGAWPENKTAAVRNLAEELWVPVIKGGKVVGEPAPLKDLVAKAAYNSEIYYRNLKPVGMDHENLGAIEIAWTGASEDFLRIGWSHSEKFDIHHWREIRPSTAEESPLQRLNLVGNHNLPANTRLNHIFLDTRACRNSGFERIQVIPRAQRYIGQSEGVVFERLQHEGRRVLFQAPATRTSFRIPVPQQSPTLHVGLGTLPGQEAARFQVKIEGESSALALDRTSRPGEWLDERVDLSNWAGQEVLITLISDEASGPALWSNPAIRAPQPELPDILWYLIDCLRADHMGLYGYPLETTPFMDAFFEKGTVFEKAYTNGNNTRSSVATLFTGILCSAIGTHRPWGSADELQLTVTEVLREMGYRTIGFVTNANGGGPAGLQQGYSQLMELDWIHSIALHPTPDKKPRLVAPIMEAMAQKLALAPEVPVFVYVHTLDAHDPYLPLEGYAERFDLAAYEAHAKRWKLPPERVEEVRRYDGELRYSDDTFRNFIEMYGKQRDLNRTMTVLLADHGDYLGERNMWYHAHWFPHLDPVRHIPFAIAYPPLNQNRRIEMPVQLTDVGSTVLGLLDRPEARLPWSMGRDLTPVLRGAEWEGHFPIISENGFSERNDFITAISMGPQTYHRVPPDEWVDRSGDAPLPLAPTDFQDILEAYRKLTLEMSALSAEAQSRDISLAELEQLRALGYIQ